MPTEIFPCPAPLTAAMVMFIKYSSGICMLVSSIKVENISPVITLVMLMLYPSIGTPCNVKGGCQKTSTVHESRLVMFHSIKPRRPLNQT